ncbi:chitin-binding type-2 domain-containing protein [Trichonephila inaurata madagascariensis]|uniref:Chitin-binding type-2 domain-containing protein n=1 Tax=Trichonephila inaurata madagascariensis TaxID=2747483 RepID=A0A8X7CUZ0_9ARAC|nr:chitin-binding type-2 domain-containing protein [Trichonephila inaurata madagascariensis]
MLIRICREVERKIKVYHHCVNSQIHTFTCPPGQAFDHRTSQCLDVSNVECIETDGHHRHKRSDVQVHTIPIGDLKSNFLEAYRKIKPELKEALQKSAPSVYEVLEVEYFPVIESFIKDMAPIVEDKVLPRLKNMFDYSAKVAGRVIKKLSDSYELSNSTHINLVSFTDLAQEIGKDMEPVLQLGRYLSNRLAKSSRPKRSATVPINEAPELLVGVLEPYLKEAFENFVELFTGNEETLTGKVILPVVVSMLKDDETRLDIQKIFWSAKSAYAPLINEMLRRQSFFTPEGTLIRIPVSEINAAKAIYYRETKPIVKKLFRKHLALFFDTLADNMELFFDTLDRLRDASRDHIGVLKDSFIRFYRKHGNTLRSAKDGHITTYTFTEITKDLKPIEVTILQIAIDYMSRMENSWISTLFTRDSIIYRTLLGGEPTYAEPSGNGYIAYHPQFNDVYQTMKKQ